MVRQSLRFGAVAIAAQVGCDHGVFFRQLRRDEPPHEIGFRMPVQKQHGLFAVAAHQGVDFDAVVHREFLLGKSGEIVFCQHAKSLLTVIFYCHYLRWPWHS